MLEYALAAGLTDADENVERKPQLEIELPRSSCLAAMLDNGGDCEPFKSSTTEVSKTRTREGLHAGAMKRSSPRSEATLPGGTQPGNKLQGKQNAGSTSQDWYPVGKGCVKVKGQMRCNKDVKKRLDYVGPPMFS